MRIVAVIPARYGSTRYPGKPLLRETGKFLVQHVYEQAMKLSSASAVIVATDDERIANAVAEFGGQSVMTRTEHPSGTDRIAEVAESIEADIFVNLQGDEPLFDVSAVDRMATALANDSSAGMATLAAPITDLATYQDANRVKVVCNDLGHALYFSRSPIPAFRDSTPNFQTTAVKLHVGIYAYRRETLIELASLPPHPLELAEKLEQLRYLAHGGAIRVETIPQAHRGIDTPDDYAHFLVEYKKSLEN